MHHILGVAAILVVLLVLARGFFGSLWRKPPERDDYEANDWSTTPGINDGHDPGSNP